MGSLVVLLASFPILLFIAAMLQQRLLLPTRGGTTVGVAHAITVTQKRHFLTAASFSKSSCLSSNVPVSRLQPCCLRAYSSDEASFSTTPQGASSSSAQDKQVTTTTTSNNFVFYIDTPEDMEDLGGLLATMSVAPTALFLDGDLGAGKTALSRGFLRAVTGDAGLVVTSPTYLLSNMYTSTTTATSSSSRVYHMDLYRLDQKETEDEMRDLLRPLNLDQIFANDITLMEWPERLGPSFLRGKNPLSNADDENKTLWPVLPSERLLVDIRIRKETPCSSINELDEGDVVEDVQSRIVTLTPIGKQWTAALQEAVDEGYVEDFLIGDDDDDQ